MRANPGGTVEVILNLVFSDLTKDLSFSYIPTLPSCFNCMNEGHLKWFGFETKEGLWCMNSKQRDQLQCLFIPLLASCLSLFHSLIPLQQLFSHCWWCLVISFRCDNKLILFFIVFLFSSHAFKSKLFSLPRFFLQPPGLVHQHFK